MIYHHNESTIGKDGEAHRVLAIHSDAPEVELGSVAFRVDAGLRMMHDIDWYVDPAIRNRGIGTYLLRVLMSEFADEIAGVERIEVNVGNERTFNVLMKIASTYDLLFAVYTTHNARPQYMIPWKEGRDILERARLGRILEEDDYDEELDSDDQLFVRLFVPDNTRKKWVEGGPLFP